MSISIFLKTFSVCLSIFLIRFTLRKTGKYCVYCVFLLVSNLKNKHSLLYKRKLSSSDSEYLKKHMLIYTNKDKKNI